jgi:glutathione S-transferase
MMITLYQFARTWGIPNLSHFCVKVETYLRMARIRYQIVETLPIKAPLGKLPYIEDNGRKIADSRVILHYLKTTYGDPLDARLSGPEAGVARAFQRLIEEHLYWVSMYTRWGYSESNWQVNKQAIFHVMPPIARDVAAWGYRHRLKRQIRGHGIGRLPVEEIWNLGREDIDALADYLGDKPYFMGSTPTALDASAYAVLVNILCCPIESPVKDYALTRQNLGDYCRRIRAEFFSEIGSAG